MKDEYDFADARRGSVLGSSPGKTRITIRLDDDVLQWFRDQANALSGGSYQTLINHALREYIAAEREPLEHMLRRVIREETQEYRVDPADG